ncbi:PQQ-dependent sugar dehydrogenase [Patulibacter defluvii]|uniref:PQQ-dependent sugar dehydrogenase n=1 Tax=Patulibacter defluvii TaxID=3095358 RepID=UPI002A75D5DB|nr:PQQ-dependent sugar dehydrogenase [Patulibacter sp. DM4]
MRARSLLLAAVLTTLPLAAAGCGDGDGDRAGDPPTTTAPAASDPAPSDDAAPDAPAITTIARGLEVPWGIAFLPDGDALVAERPGRIVRIGARDQRLRTVRRMPGVAADGEGGLLGLAVSPRFARDRLVYAYLTTAEDNRVVRFRLDRPEAAPTPILTGLARGAIHDGGRIAFGPDGRLYVGVGDTGDPALAQDRDARNGKILRIAADGSIPDDNPIGGSPVWSLGHRNVQGLAWDGAGRLWASEFGQDRWDEINLIRPGRNYGWPRVEGHGTGGGAYVDPLVTWPTSEASPSGIAIVGDQLYVAALRGERLWRVRLPSAVRGGPTRPGRPQALLAGRLGRLRTVVAAPDGSLWIATSNRDGRGRVREGDDRIVRLAVR